MTDARGDDEQTAHGSCLCGAVAFRVDGPFKAFQYCHCSRCRKNSGSAHGASLFVPTAQFAWERGEAAVKRYDLPTAKYWSCAFCATCGARMPWLSRTGKAYIIPAGVLDDDPGVRPTRNIHFGSRAPWYTPASELETHETQPE